MAGKNPLDGFYSFAGGVLKAIVKGIFADKKLTAGRRANLVIDIVLLIPFLALFTKANEYTLLANFVLMALFSAWCLAKVK